MPSSKGKKVDARSGAGFQSIYLDLQRIHGEKERGDAFEKVVLYFLRHDPVWSQRLGLDERPGHVRLWAEADDWRWSGRDLGTDLLVKDLDGNLWAVQAKCWRDDSTVRKEEVDSFLADSNRPSVTKRLLVTTASGLSRNAWDTIRAQEKPTDVVCSQALFDSRINWPSSLEDVLENVRRPKLERRPRQAKPHQDNAINDICTHFAKRSPQRGQVLMASGSGKTLVAQRATERLGAKTTLVLLPSLMLLGQTLRDWTADADTGHEFEWIAVCSDSSVERGGTDHFVERVEDLGIPNVTTEPDEIRAFLTSRRRRGRPRRVVFATYQSSGRIAEAIKASQTSVKFDMVICDEAHRMARLSRRKGEDDSFTLPLDDTEIPSRRRMFLTATPRVFSDGLKARAEAGGYEDLIFCMEDESLFGPVVHEYPLRQAIIDGVLADYRVLAVAVVDGEVKTLIDGQSQVALKHPEAGTLTVHDSASAATQVAIAKAMEMRDYQISSAITFHNSIRAAETFADEHNRFRQLLGLRTIDVDTVRGSDAAHKRTRKLQILGQRDRKGLVSNARCLTEGIDVPLLDAVAFIEPRYSVIDIAQAIGRAIRKPSDDKVTGYVVVPIFLSASLVKRLQRNGRRSGPIDSSELDDELLREVNVSFSGVIEVLQGLRSLDGTLAEQIRSLRVERGKRGRRAKSNRAMVSVKGGKGRGQQGALPVILDLRGIQGRKPPLGFHEATIDASISLQRFTDSLSALLLDEILSRCAESWWEVFGSLDAFVVAKQRYPTRYAESVDESRLGIWVENQRVQRKRGSLRQERIDALESLPSWLWDTRTGKWMRTFDQVQNFVALNKRLPGLYAEDPAERSLGIWIVTQRQRRLGKTSKRSLTAEETAHLESLPDWSWGPQGDAWERQRARLDEFLLRNGRLPRSAGTGYVKNRDEESLARWCQKQRAKYNSGDLASERADSLEEVPGWAWDPKEVAWLAQYELVCEFVGENDRLPRETEKDIDEDARGRWLAKQRKAVRRGTIDKRRLTLLQTLPGWGE